MSVANSTDTFSRPSMTVDFASDLVRARTQVGDFELTICTDGSYRLDGGAMFGVGPKMLWQKRAPADPSAQPRLLRRTRRSLRDGRAPRRSTPTCGSRR